jgi:NTP pyrophosphatase (non-canonical NTP hydrolase)
MAHEEFRPTDLQGALAHLVEECGEVLSAAGKTQRYGFDSVNPLLPKHQQETNADWLWREMEDLKMAIDNLQRKMRQDDPSGMASTLFRYFPTARSLKVVEGTPDYVKLNELRKARLVRFDPTASFDYTLVHITARGLEAMGKLHGAAH